MYFNPRSRTGSDPCLWHTPGRQNNFNPRSRTGSDHIIRIQAQLGELFQPTLPHRERPSGCWTTSNTPKFQPTLPHRERRNWAGEIRYPADISTHAPAQGATLSTKLVDSQFFISTHAPAQGATHQRIQPPAGGGISTHAPAQGATCRWLYLICSWVISTHAPAQGATL